MLKIKCAKNRLRQRPRDFNIYFYVKEVCNKIQLFFFIFLFFS